MGVMTCSRRECENIMCETYIDKVGYICGECKDEFKEYLEKIGKTDLREGEIRKQLDIFMYTIKVYHTGNKISINDFFDKHTNRF